MKQTEILTHATHVNGWEPAVYMSCTSQNFRLFHVSNLSVRNFRIFLLMYTGSLSPLRRINRPSQPVSGPVNFRRAAAGGHDGDGKAYEGSRDRGWRRDWGCGLDRDRDRGVTKTLRCDGAVCKSRGTPLPALISCRDGHRSIEQPCAVRCGCYVICSGAFRTV